MVHGKKSYTTSENMRAPSMEIYLKRMIDAWSQLPDNLIKSFKGCGLTNALDSSEVLKMSRMIAIAMSYLVFKSEFLITYQ